MFPILLNRQFCFTINVESLPSSNPSELNDGDVAIPIVCPLLAFDIEPKIGYDVVNLVQF